MARKGWDSLRPDYRARLEKNGVTRADYDSGASLKKGRGHENTPERPRQFDPAKFPNYAAERERLTKELLAKKERMWKDRPRWRQKGAENSIREKPPSMHLLRWAVGASEDELLDAIREDPETYKLLGYH